MDLRTWRPKNPVVTGLAVTAVAAVVGAAWGKKRGKPGAGAALFGLGAFLVHDRWVDGMSPFHLWPFCRGGPDGYPLQPGERPER